MRDRSHRLTNTQLRKVERLLTEFQEIKEKPDMAELYNQTRNITGLALMKLPRLLEENGVKTHWSRSDPHQLDEEQTALEAQQSGRA